jgi:hypothetical protein
LIDRGKVNSVHRVAGKVIVAVALNDAADEAILNHASVQFGESERAIKLSGFKWWPERQEVDLLFDDLENPPEIGSTTFIVSSI